MASVAPCLEGCFVETWMTLGNHVILEFQNHGFQLAVVFFFFLFLQPATKVSSGKVVFENVSGKCDSFSF